MIRKVHLQVILFGITIFLTLLSHASQPDDAKKTKTINLLEITQVDITKYANIIASEIQIFGISFDMSIEIALQTVDKNPFVFFEVDPFNSSRYYLYDYMTQNAKHLPLAYFIWDEFGQKIEEVILYTAFERYLVGASKNLLSIDVINKHSDIVKEFMGYPTRKETTLDIPSISVKTFCYYYPEHDFKVFRNFNDKGSSISFGLMRTLD
jgi:hypothetical protein